jgi:hypothetical protein
VRWVTGVRPGPISGRPGTGLYGGRFNSLRNRPSLRTQDARGPQGTEPRRHYIDVSYDVNPMYCWPVQYNIRMKHIRTHLKKAMGDARKTERGELMEYFCQKLNRSRARDGLPKITMGRMGKMLQNIPTKDLYYIKRVCDDAENFSKKFWYLLHPEKYKKGTDERKSRKS